MARLPFTLSCVLFALVPATAWTQQPDVTIIHPKEPSLISSERLSVRSKHGLAIFSGNVVVKQTDGPELHCSRAIFRWRRPLAAHRQTMGYLICEP